MTIDDRDLLQIDPTEAACLFHGLADPSRVAILRHLAAGEQRVVDLVALVGLAQSTVSKHLACMRDCGLVTSEPVGRASVHRLAHPDLVLRLLDVADDLLSATGQPTAPQPALTSGAAR